METRNEKEENRVAARLFEAKAQYGFCNSKGEVVVDARYDNAKSNNYFNAFLVGGKWGFLDNDGKCLREAEYDSVELIGKYAIVQKDDFFGVLNSKMYEILPVEYIGIRKSLYKDFYILETKEECYEIASSEFEIVERTYKYTVVGSHYSYIALFSKYNRKITVLACDRKYEFDSKVNIRDFYHFETCGSRIFIEAVAYNDELIIVVKYSDGKLNHIEGCTEIRDISAHYIAAKINGKYYVYIVDDLTIVRFKDFEPCDNCHMGDDDSISVKRGRRYYIYDTTSMKLKFKGSKLRFNIYIYKNKLSYYLKLL